MDLSGPGINVKLKERKKERYRVRRALILIYVLNFFAGPNFTTWQLKKRSCEFFEGVFGEKAPKFGSFEGKKDGLPF
jgi:hypothetical protein